MVRDVLGVPCLIGLVFQAIHLKTEAEAESVGRQERVLWLG